MNETELLREARLKGIRSPEELTFGEVRAALELAEERERRILQALAVIAYRHAALTAQALAGERLPPLGEAFPFWSEEELRQARLEHYRQVMERHAGRGGKEHQDGT